MLIPESDLWKLCLAGKAGQLAVLGVIITIRLHCVEDLSHSSEEQEQWDGKINVW